MAVYTHTNTATGRIVITAKAMSGKWVALTPGTHDIITSGHKTRSDALYVAFRKLDQGV